MVYFYPRPPRGGRPIQYPRSRSPCCNFYPRPPRGGRPGEKQAPKSASFISIHALREEGDLLLSPGQVDSALFLSTPSARRATPPKYRTGCRIQISIHALREEGDSDSLCSRIASKIFLSTPSARRATPASVALCGCADFYPRPPRGGRPAAASDSNSPPPNFYPRPPRGGRPRFSASFCLYDAFLSTPSARRATVSSL